jgi:arylsulfatase A-like enzyme
MSKTAQLASVVSSLAIAWPACGGQGTHGTQGKVVPASAASAASGAFAPTAPPALDEAGPSLDLVSSNALFHLYKRGLVIPFSSEGFRKYSQEYTNPWKGTSKIEERTGRVLGSTAATLRFPWRDEAGEATVIVRVQGGSAGKKLSVRLNGKPIKNAALDSGWQQLAIPVSAGVLLKGENTLALGTGKKGAFFHSIEIAAGKVGEPADAWPAASAATTLSAGGKDRPALAGFSRMMILVEIPQDGWLVLGTFGAAHFQVTVATESGPAKLLLDEKQTVPMAPERRLSLAEFAGKLVALELAIHDGAADAAWIAPRILLPKVAVSPKTRPIHNTILLVADALRADKLPMFANSRVRAPNIAKTAEAMGISFTTTQAASPSSPPSHATIQSGCMPRKSGILGDKSKLNPGTPMVSALLAKAGVATDFVGDASFAMKRLLPASTWNEFHQPNAEGKGGDCSAVIKQILAFADKQGDKRFFVSAVAFEAHTPYIYHEGTTEHYYSGPLDPAIGKSPDGVILTAIVGRKLTMTPERWGQLKGLYDGEVEHLDGCFGALTEGLQSRGLADSTDIILLADHGEGFLEHGSMGHAYGQYAELTHVPLTFFLPGVGHGQKIDTVVGHIDVVPTILDRMGIGADPRLQGESLLPMMSRQGPWMPRVMPSEYGRSYSLRARDLHYVVDYGGNESLFAVATDPDEKTDVKDRRPLALRYFRDLAGIYLAHRAQWSTAAWGTLNNHRAGFAAATQGATAP